MTVETLQMLSTVAYVLAGVFLLAAIAIFFLLDIRSVIGDVTGATARKAIRDIRAQNEASGNKAYKPSPVNAARGKLTAKISPSGRLEPQMAGMGGSPGTEKLSTMELTAAAEATTVLTETAAETTVLQQPEEVGATTVLSEAEREPAAPKPEEKRTFQTDVEMGFSASSEIIE